MPEIAKQDYLIGVDLGGTKILAGVFDARLKCVGRTKLTTKAERGADGVIERIARAVKEAIDECDLTLKQVRGLGIGSPGSIDQENGRGGRLDEWTARAGVSIRFPTGSTGLSAN